MNKFFKYFHFNTAERYGLIVLTLGIFSINILIFIYRQFVPKNTIKFELTKLDDRAVLTEAAINEVYEESLRRPATNPIASIHYFNFDPNTISPEEWTQLGLSAKQIKVITNYVAKGGKFFNKEDLRKIYSISERDYARLEPYITISTPQKTATVYQPTERPTKYSESNSRKVIVKVNEADTPAFKSLRGIGSVLASRIVKFRDGLGSFHDLKQLKEVYGISEETFQQIAEQLELAGHPIKKLEINTLDINALSKHPYINKKQAQLIVNFRNEHGPYTDMRNLSQNKGLDPEFLRKIEPYLEF